MPTEGLRNNLLLRNLKSIIKANVANEIIIISRNNINIQDFNLKDLDPDLIIINIKTELNLVQAINFGIKNAKNEFFFWLNDDDIITSEFRELVSTIDSNDDIGMVYSVCGYVSKSNRELGKTKFGRFAKILFKFGPNLIPQPSTLFRTSVVKNSGGLDETLKYAFDQDLYHKLDRTTKIKFVAVLTSKYMFHVDTLSNRNRLKSIVESFEVRNKYLGNLGVLINYVMLPCTLLTIYLFTIVLKMKTLNEE